MEFHRLFGTTPDRDTNLAPGELITAVDLPAISYAKRSTYLKARDRNSYAFALVSVAAIIDSDEDQLVRHAHIALGGVAHKPWRASEAKRVLAGKRLDEATLRGGSRGGTARREALSRKRLQGGACQAFYCACGKNGREYRLVQRYNRGSTMGNLIGEPIDRIDGRLKGIGRAPYAYEHDVPGALYATLIMSTIARGRIASMNTRLAARASGVLLVMTHLNAPKLPRLESQPKKPPTGRVVQVLQDGLVRYANQPIGVVIAETLEAAEEAAQLMDVKYAAEQPQVELESRLAEAAEGRRRAGPFRIPARRYESGMATAAVRIHHAYERRLRSTIQ